MNNRELVSRISNQLRMITKDENISDRLVLNTAKSIARKFITQKTQRRSIDRDMSLYKEVKCIEFETIDTFSCKFIEFQSCEKLSRSKVKFSDLIFTRYGSSVKELYSIDRRNNFSESTLYQYRNNSERKGGDITEQNKFYILDNYIYVTDEVEALSGLVLVLDQYELEEACGCTENCKSVWDFEFVCPDSVLEDVISYTIQNMMMTKQIQPDENPNLNENSK